MSEFKSKICRCGAPLASTATQHAFDVELEREGGSSDEVEMRLWGKLHCWSAFGASHRNNVEQAERLRLHREIQTLQDVIISALSDYESGEDVAKVMARLADAKSAWSKR